MEKFPKWLINIVIVLIAILWAVSIVVNMYDHNYPIPGQLQLAMSAVLSALIGNQYFFASKKKDGQDK